MMGQFTSTEPLLGMSSFFHLLIDGEAIRGPRLVRSGDLDPVR